MTNETLNESLERVQLMASGDPQWDLSDNDQHALKKVLMEIILLREALHDLREAISPGRKANAEYYLGVAQRMRSKETIIKPMTKVSSRPE